MEWVLAALAVVAIAMAAVASTGRGGAMPDLVDDRDAPDLPTGDITAADLRSVTFAVVPRGYSMAQVDHLMARLAEQLGADEPQPEPFEVDPPPAPAPVVYGPQTDLDAQH